MSVLHTVYQVAVSGKWYGKARKEASMKFQLLTVLSPLIHITVIRTLMNIVLFMKASLKGVETLYCSFLHFQES